MYEFIQKQCFDNVFKEKDRIIKFAANLIAQDIEGIESDPASYFSVDDIDIEYQYNMMPSSLKNFITHLIPKRLTADKSTNIGTIYQVLVALLSSYKVVLWESSRSASCERVAINHMCFAKMWFYMQQKISEEI